MTYPQAWQHIFVAQLEPFFLSEETRAQLPTEWLTLSCAEFSKQCINLWHLDSYFFHGLDKRAQHVLSLHADAFLHLSPNLQQLLLKEQLELKRAHIYPWHRLSPYLADIPSHRHFQHEGQRYIALDYPLWHALSSEVKNSLLDYHLQQSAANHSPLAPQQYIPTNSPNRATLQALANSWAKDSGANCFASSIAACLNNVAQAQSIAAMWLHQAPFYVMLAQLSFKEHTPIPETITKDFSPPPDSILIWYDEANVAQHACYSLGKGIVLNKNSQAWYAQRQLVHSKTVLNDWGRQNIRIFSREHHEKEAQATSYLDS